MLSTIAEDYILSEFSRANAKHLFSFLEKRFSNGITTWTGSLVVVEFERASNRLTISDIFCGYEDQIVDWDDFKRYVLMKWRLE